METNKKNKLAPYSLIKGNHLTKATMVDQDDVMKGNLLKLEGVIYKVIGFNYTEIFLSSLVIGGYDCWVKIDRLEPIPLTEDWLIDKFGFIRSYNNSFVIEINEKLIIINQNFTFGGSEINVKLNYVHEVQNLIYILTKRKHYLK